MDFEWAGKAYHTPKLNHVTARACRQTDTYRPRACACAAHAHCTPRQTYRPVLGSSWPMLLVRGVLWEAIILGYNWTTPPPNWAKLNQWRPAGRHFLLGSISLVFILDENENFQYIFTTTVGKAPARPTFYSFFFFFF